LQEDVLKRLDVIFASTKRLGMVIVLTFFDVQAMAEEWKTHPYNLENGGMCESASEFFTNVQQRQKETRRIEQLIERYESFDHVIWELGRGLNIDELSSGTPDQELRNSITQWTIIMREVIRRKDLRPHLTAISFVPNTLPYHLMDIRSINVFFLHIKSDDPLRALKSTHQFINIVRGWRRPVFIGEITGNGTAGRETELKQNILWGSFAAASGAFLHSGSTNEISGSDLELLQSLKLCLSMVKLDGKPRPPADPSPKAMPEDSYYVIEHIVGYDWLFWLYRKSPGKNRAQITFKTKAGWYDYQWFDVENTRIHQSQSRKNTRDILWMESPEFEQMIFGRLRHITPPEQK